MQPIDLTGDKDFLLTIKVDGKIYAYGRAQLERLVKLDQQMTPQIATERLEDTIESAKTGLSSKAFQDGVYKPVDGRQFLQKHRTPKSYAAIGKKVSVLYEANKKLRQLTSKEEAELMEYLICFDGVPPKRYGSRTPELLVKMLKWGLGSAVTVEIKKMVSRLK